MGNGKGNRNPVVFRMDINANNMQRSDKSDCHRETSKTQAHGIYKKEQRQSDAPSVQYARANYHRVTFPYVFAKPVGDMQGWQTLEQLHGE